MRRLTIGTLLVLAACSGTPSSPSSAVATPVTPSLTGAWSGTFRPTDCTGDRQCIPMRIAGSVLGFTLKLQQTGSRVQGSFSDGRFTADVTGDMAPDGWVTLSGATPPSAANGSMRVTAVSVRATTAGALDGRVAHETEPSLQESAFALPASYGGDMVSVTRMPS